MVSISIVLYKTPIYQLKRCLQSLKIIFPVPYLYIVDNSPTDELANFFINESNVNYMHVPSNPGFGAAHNIAMKIARLAGFDFHLVLNADVYFYEDVLTPMVEYMVRHNNVGLMMPKVLNPDGSLQRLCKLVPSPVDLFLRRIKLPFLKKTSNDRFELHESGYNKIMFVPYLSGCFMLLRHSVAQEVGGFDERFFMYPEDIDLTRRIAINLDTLFYPAVSVYHDHGAASHKNLRMFFIHAINICKYFNKWGWFYDTQRRQLNKKTLSLLGLR